MLKRFLHWYIRKYLSQEFILKGAIADELSKARTEEADRWNKICERDMAHQKELLEVERHIAVSAKEAEIRRLSAMLDELQDNKRAQEMFEANNKKVARENFTLSVELQLAMRNMLELGGEMLGKLDILERKTRKGIKLLNDREE